MSENKKNDRGLCGIFKFRLKRQIHTYVTKKDSWIGK